MLSRQEADKESRSKSPSESQKLNHSMTDVCDRELSTAKASSRSTSNLASSNKSLMIAGDVLFVPTKSREFVGKSFEGLKEANGPGIDGKIKPTSRQINSAVVVVPSRPDNAVSKQTTRQINSAVGASRQDIGVEKQQTSQKSISVANTPRPDRAAMKSARGGGQVVSSRPSSRASSN